MKTYGRLNADRSNAILICHALSGSGHAAIPRGRRCQAGLGGRLHGPGKAFDTDRSSSSAATGSAVATAPPGPCSSSRRRVCRTGCASRWVTIGDMVRAQVKLIDHLGIDQLLCVAGGSMGGMQVLEWAAHHAARVKSVMPLATTAHHSPMLIAFQRGGASGHLRRSLLGQWRLLSQRKEAGRGLAAARWATSPT
ncbi:MAG: alpha/beta fold hydrolase [Caldilineaceae bacterium]